MKKANISLKRKVTIYYQRLVLALKISILVLLVSFFFTDLFKTTNDNVKGKIPDFIKEAGFKEITILQSINTMIGTFSYFKAKKR